MRRLLTLIALATTTVAAIAQTLNIQQGQVVTAVPADQAGDMTYSAGGQQLTVCGKTFSTSEITQIYIDNADVTDNTVSVAYNGSTATVTLSGNVARYLTATVSGAHVSVTQASDLPDEVTYTLSGASTDGSFTMTGSLKATLVLAGLQLTSTKGAAIDIEDGKRIAIEVADGTENTLADAADGQQKACFFVKGHAELTGGGTLTLVGNAKHAYRSNEYTQLKKKFGTLRVSAAASDGMHVGQYFQMNGGTVNISGVGGDGIDVEATSDASDELNGQAIVKGGTLTVVTTADDVKALKADADITIADGTLSLTATGDGSKGISSKGAVSIEGGQVVVTTTGGVYAEGTDNDAKPHGLKATGNVTISGGELYVACQRKAIDTDGALAINGGRVLGIGTKSSAENQGTQGSRVYTKQTIEAGQTVSYDDISYTVPAIYSSSSATVLVSPVSSGSSTKKSSLADNNVTVTWSADGAAVDVADNISGLVTVSQNGGHVALLQDEAATSEITYTLSGASQNGSSCWPTAPPTRWPTAPAASRRPVSW